MGIVMNMSNYEIEPNSVDAKYGKEVMRADWNSSAALMCHQQSAVPANREIFMPPDLATAGTKEFLRKMHAYQR